MNEKIGKRIFHPYTKWEDYPNSFYDNCTGSEKAIKKQLVTDMFNSKEETERCMFYVVDNWTYSMEHNLTNPSINKIAYIGQTACAYFGNIPSTITMETWSSLTDEVKERANSIAKQAIQRWNTNNKFIQLCLSLD